MDLDTHTRFDESFHDSDDLSYDHHERLSRPSRRRRRWPFAAGALALLAVSAGGVSWWWETRFLVSTSDARIDGYITQVAPQVAGRVTQLLVGDYQHVTAGQVLLRLDPRDFQARLDQEEAQETSAEAQVVEAQAKLAAQLADLNQSAADVAVAEANLLQAQRDNQRYQSLPAGVVAEKQRDQTETAFRAAQAKLLASQQAMTAAKAQIEVAKGQLAAARAGVARTTAAVESAKLQLSYTTITAPVTGTVARRAIDVGDVVQPSQPMFAIVQDDLWVQADFKETQLAGMRPGDRVLISVDAVPGHEFHGTVNSFQPGTGSVFSALPAENATGNWVKVVQRLPVKITFEGTDYRKYFLAPGMSAEPTVDLKGAAAPRVPIYQARYVRDGRAWLAKAQLRLAGEYESLRSRVAAKFNEVTHALAAHK